MSGWAKQLSDRLDAPAEDHQAMEAAGYHYQGGSGPHDDALIDWMHQHMDINDVARGKLDPGQLFVPPDFDALDAAMQPSTRPMVVYRGVDSRTVSDEWTDPGYATTSASEMVAGHYADGAGNGAILRIRVPAGVRSASIGQMPPDRGWQITDLEDSGEVLLQRGLRFRRLGPTWGRVIDVEVVR